ncbi:hypothetical protein Pla22_03470 [Rubripirellula amarantea]|uniref:Uncharacterized protein n=1 Tax=Rubripirellula amarantea TaxID=2527999 RepID=A0A5C5WRH4_9BACT|nr:hypothetical protein Pla22_03470 [Rubripirellula amarantea]
MVGLTYDDVSIPNQGNYRPQIERANPANHLAIGFVGDSGVEKSPTVGTSLSDIDGTDV